MTTAHKSGRRDVGGHLPASSGAGRPAGSAPDKLCDAIRTCIASGEFVGGQRLTEEELARSFRASRTSVREALRVLDAEGFVSVRPYFGTFVTEMTRGQAAELLEVQGALEALAAGLAAQRRSAADIAGLRSVIALGRRAATEGRRGDTAILHGEFHAKLARAGRNEMLAQLMTQLRHKFDWVYGTKVGRPPVDAWEEHSQMVDAVERRDVDGAVERAHFHIERGSLARNDRPDMTQASAEDRSRS